MAKTPKTTKTAQKKLNKAKCAVQFLTTPRIPMEGQLPPQMSDEEKAAAREILRHGTPEQRWAIELEVARVWEEELIHQQTDLIYRRAFLIASDQPSSISYCTIALRTAHENIRAVGERVSALETMLGEGEILEPDRVINVQGGGKVEG